MHVKCLSTRHTAIGTFRFGVTYEVNEKEPAIKKHVLPLLKSDPPALKKLSKAQVEAESNPAQFTPQGTPVDADATAADLRQALAKSEQDRKAAESAEAKAIERAEKAEDEVEKLADALEEVRDELATLKSASPDAGTDAPTTDKPKK